MGAFLIVYPPPVIDDLILEAPDLVLVIVVELELELELEIELEIENIITRYGLVDIIHNEHIVLNKIIINLLQILGSIINFLYPTSKCCRKRNIIFCKIPIFILCAVYLRIVCIWCNSGKLEH